MTREDLEQDLAHHQELIRVLIRRRQDRERQSARYGIDVPPHISTELEDLALQIQEQKQKILDIELSLAALADGENADIPAINTSTWGIAIVLAFIIIIGFFGWQQARLRSDQTIEAAQAPTTEPAEAILASQNISGEWQGILVDETNIQFDYSISFSQIGDQVDGTSIARFRDPSLSQYYMRTRFKAIIHDNVLEFNELEFLTYNPEPGGIWCVIVQGGVTRQ